MRLAPVELNKTSQQPPRGNWPQSTPKLCHHYRAEAYRRTVTGHRRLFRAPFRLRCSQAGTAGIRQPGELRAATWDEFDLEAAEWRIPARRTKLRVEQVVPLAEQAVAILDDLFPLTGSESGFVFPSIRSRSTCMSDNSLNAALRRMGYPKDQMTAHGFRAMASTRLNELGFAPDIIERQLAHAERNKIRAAYNHASYLPQRQEMMQFWADHLDGLKTDVDVG